jgi:hypothetical protein
MHLVCGPPQTCITETPHLWANTVQYCPLTTAQLHARARPTDVDKTKHLTINAQHAHEQSKQAFIYSQRAVRVAPTRAQRTPAHAGEATKNCLWGPPKYALAPAAPQIAPGRQQGHHHPNRHKQDCTTQVGFHELRSTLCVLASRTGTRSLAHRTGAPPPLTGWWG